MRETKRRKRSNKVKFLVCGLFFIAAGSTAAYKGYQMGQTLDEYESRMKELDEKLEEEQKRTAEIEDYQDYVKTDQYVEEIARDKLGLVYKDEVLLKANEEE